MFATTMPITRASEENVKKYNIALPVTRPTRLILVILAIPVTTVKKMTGAIIIFTILIKASPKGFKLSPNSG